MKCNKCGKREALVLAWTCVVGGSGYGFVLPELLCRECLITQFGMGEYGPSEVPMAMDLATIKTLGFPYANSVFYREEMKHNEFTSAHWKGLLENISGTPISTGEPQESPAGRKLDGNTATTSDPGQKKIP